jgi:4a-hydroxytetrahydrobiopterin dehydratase
MGGSIMATASELVQKHCVPCEGGIPALSLAEAQQLAKSVPAWRLTNDAKAIRREWRVKDFLTAIGFFDRVAHIAEDEDHHPDLHLTGYRNVAVEISTHAVGGLTENDFILAAKIDQLPVSLKT